MPTTSLNYFIKNHDLLLLTLEVIKNDNNISLRAQEVLSLRKFINESNKKIRLNRFMIKTRREFRKYFK